MINPERTSVDISLKPLMDSNGNVHCITRAIKARQIITAATIATDSSLSMDIYSSSTFSFEKIMTNREP